MGMQIIHQSQSVIRVAVNYHLGNILIALWRNSSACEIRFTIEHQLNRWIFYNITWFFNNSPLSRSRQRLKCVEHAIVTDLFLSFCIFRHSQLRFHIVLPSSLNVVKNKTGQTNRIIVWSVEIYIDCMDTWYMYRGSGTIGPITWFNPPKPGPQSRALCCTVCAALSIAFVHY